MPALLFGTITAAYVLAFEPVAASPAYYNEDFLRRYEYRGSPVTVTAGQVIRLDLIRVKVQLQ